ncbi:MAG: hypothetical protein ACI8SK_001559, partial [Shewanella sp.]
WKMRLRQLFHLVLSFAFVDKTAFVFIIASSI